MMLLIRAIEYKTIRNNDAYNKCHCKSPYNDTL